MKVFDEPRHWLQALAEAPKALLMSPNWLVQSRAAAQQALRRLPMPDHKQEAWRYTRIDGLREHNFRPAATLPDAQTAQRVEAGLWPAEDVHRLVFVNGQCIPHLSDVRDLPHGVTLGSVNAMLASDPEMLSAWFAQTVQHTDNVFTALNTALLNDGLFLRVAAGVSVDRPIEIIYLSLAADEPPLIQPRNLVVLGAGARATLIEHFCAPEPAVYFHNGLSDIVVEQAASLRHYRIQDESRNAYHLSSIYLTQQGRSHYDGLSFAFGGCWARTDYHSRFTQAGAECLLSGLYTVGDGQLTDFHLDVHHSVPDCISRERFKGLLYGKGRAVFDGRVRVDKQAQHTDARLSNANLMLSRDAEVDTKPQLEIYADDVQCSHGTTVGQLEAQQLFYLRSRGIDELTARRMLSLGFAGDIIDAIGVASLHAAVSGKLRETLDCALIPSVEESAA